SFSSYASQSMLPHDIYFNRNRNELLVGVAGGLLFYSPQPVTGKLNYPVVLTAIKEDGKDVTTKVNNGTWQHRVPYRFNSIEFEFAALYYGTCPGIYYEYKLEGYDKDWVNAGKQHTVMYQNLPPGKYLFHVRSRDTNGNIAGEVSDFSFSIVPPFWQ